jgi:hypothetical protein
MGLPRRRSTPDLAVCCCNPSFNLRYSTRHRALRRRKWDRALLPAARHRLRSLARDAIRVLMGRFAFPLLVAMAV